MKLPKIQTKTSIDDLLIIAFLILTIWHSAHVLAAFELIGELAWPLAIGIDVGIARAAYVTSSQSKDGARIIAGLWLLFLLTASYGINIAYYNSRGGTDWAWALASLFPVSLAAVGGIKSFLKQSVSDGAGPTVAPLGTELSVQVPTVKENTNLPTVINIPENHFASWQEPAPKLNLLDAYKRGELSDQDAIEAGVKPGTLASWRTRYKRTQTVTTVESEF